ncbi:MAG: hypothetical protein HY238_01000 [Acidobacteria bacterium]|nr:hypothetical protein [Acidobacteriota bacterium]
MRWKSILLPAALLLTILFPALAKDNKGEELETVVLVLRFDQSYSPTTLEAMKDEIALLMRPAEYQVEWRAYEEALGEEIFSRLAIVRFRGTCRMGEFPPPAERSSALAIAHSSDGVIIPYADVQCDQVRGMIQSMVARENFPRREMLLGRALGRVLAHELYHVLTRKPGHHKDGITKPALTPRDLVVDPIEFEDAALDHLRHSDESEASR